MEIGSKKQAKPELWATIQQRLRVDWTYDSNAIEGSSLTRGETLFFLQEGLTVEGKPFKDFLDPWGNRIEIIDYQTIQYTKAPNVLRGMGLEDLGKTDEALAELADKGMAPDA